jgi:hypothetical protein
MEHFADALPLSDYRERARYRQLRGRHGVGVVVQQAVFADEDGRRWICVATDAVEAAVEARAGDYPERSRLSALVNASPVVLTLADVGGEE